MPSQFHDLPQEMQDRMPSAYTRALKLPIRSQIGDELYASVMDLASSYRLNYELLFPPIEEVMMLTQAAKVLAVPSKSSFPAVTVGGL
jgi:RNA polymerase I-specific transcription initiation factor RRN7